MKTPVSNPGFKLELACLPYVEVKLQEKLQEHAVGRCRLTHQVDPGLKALGFEPVESTSLSNFWFQMLRQVDPRLKALGFNQLKVIPFNVLLSTVNLHPYIAATKKELAAMQRQAKEWDAKKKDLEGQVSVRRRRCSRLNTSG